jgi:predicted ribonuclease YlaK
MRKVLNHETYQMSDIDLRDQLLETLEYLLNKRGSNITDFNLPRKSTNTNSQSINCLFNKELCYDANNLLNESEYMIGQLNSEQQYAFHSIMDTVLHNKPRLFFVSGYGGTGKTFLWNTIITYLRGHRKMS